MKSRFNSDIPHQFGCRTPNSTKAPQDKSRQLNLQNTCLFGCNVDVGFLQKFAKLPCALKSHPEFDSLCIRQFSNKLVALRQKSGEPIPCPPITNTSTRSSTVCSLCQKSSATQSSSVCRCCLLWQAPFGCTCFANHLKRIKFTLREPCS